MISIMTNQGALEFGRSLSGGSRFLAWEVALLDSPFEGSASDVASLTSESVELDSDGKHGMIGNKHIAYRFPCTGSLPVQVSSDDDNSHIKAMAVDFDFNGQVPFAKAEGSEGVDSIIEYYSVVALGRRFSEYSEVATGRTYRIGDHVWAFGDFAKEWAYVCINDNNGEGFVYAGVPVADDTAHWMAIAMDTLVRHPVDPNFFSDPFQHDANGVIIPPETIPFFITSYDDAVTLANGMEWEYKVRVFLDNVATTKLPELNYFSKGGMEANGSLMLTFLASISEQFRTIRNQVSSAT